MGNKHKKKKPTKNNQTVTAEEERQKIRDSILKVFRERVTKTDDAGAVLVCKDAVTEVNHNTLTHEKNDRHKITKDKRPISADTISSSDSSTTYSDDSSSDRPIKKRIKHKRRKKSKNKTDCLQKKKTDEKRLEADKISKSAHDSGYPNMLKCRSMESRGQPAQKSSFITHNRLTQRLGLFNRGKKSETIAREIHPSDSLKKKTEDDLLRILNQTRSEASSRKLEIRDEDRGGVNSTITEDSVSLIDDYEPPQTRTTPYSAELPISTWSGNSTKSIHSDEEQKPPHEKIAADLKDTLKPGKFFLGRNLFEENREELRKIMRQNIPRSETPVHSIKMATPASQISTKRSLIQSYPPRSDIKSGDSALGGTETEVCENSFYSQGSAKSFEISCTDASQNTKKYLSQVTASVKPSSFPNTLVQPSSLTDANILLRYNDMIISDKLNSSNNHCTKRNPDTDSKGTFNSDARQILMQNDTERSKRWARDSFYMDSVSSNGSSFMCYSSSQSSGYHEPPRVRHNQGDAGDMRHYQTVLPVMPSQHNKPRMPDYYPRPLHNQHCPSDFLDLVEDYGSDNHLRHMENVSASVNKLKSATPDSDGSPLWLIPVATTFPKKPSLDTPSPIDKMYPRRLY